MYLFEYYYCDQRVNKECIQSEPGEDRNEVGWTQEIGIGDQFG